MLSVLSRPPFPLRASDARRTLSYTVTRLRESGDKSHDPLQSLTTDGPKKDVLPSLSRPLGVRERPTIFKKTRTERIKELMDRDARMDQRRHLYAHQSEPAPLLTPRAGSRKPVQAIFMIST